MNKQRKNNHIFVKKTSSMPLVLVFITSLMLFLLSFFFIVFVDKTYEHWPIILMVSVSIWFCIFVIASKKTKNSYLLFSTAFLFALSIFHLSHIALHVLGIHNFPSFYDNKMGIYYQKGSWLVVLAISSFGLGFSFTNGIKAYNKSSLLKSTSAEVGRALCWWYGIGLFLASIFSLALLFYSVGNIFIYSRSQLFAGIGDTRGFGLFQMFLPTSLILLTLGANTKKQRYAIFALLIFFGLLLLFMGYRSQVMFPALIGFILWHKTGREFKKIIIIPIIIFLVFAIPTVRYLRAVGSYNSLSTEDVSNSIKQAKVDDIFQELGGTNNVVVYVLKWIPSEEDYRYGYTYWLALKNSVPNIGFNISTSSRKKVKSKSDIVNLSASDWFVYRYNRWMFDTGGGSGFSMVAEPYLNFGIPGVVIFFMLLGYILGKLDSVNLLQNPIILLISASIMWPLIKSVRNDFTTFFKPAVFILIVFLLWKIITFWKKRRYTISRRKELLY